MQVTLPENLEQTQAAKSSSLNLTSLAEKFKPESLFREIHEVLAKYQRDESDWDHREFIKAMQIYAMVLLFRFNLELHELAFSVDQKFRFRETVRFRRGINALGLRGEIQVHGKHAVNAPLWKLFASLLKALLEAWRQENCPTEDRTSGYYDDEFQRKARECGLEIDEDGFIWIDPSGKFADLMGELKIELPNEEGLSEPIRKPKGDSKQKKWSCLGCKKPVNARVAVPDFAALCLKCRTLFVRKNEDGSDRNSKRQATTLDLLRETWIGWAGRLYEIASCPGSQRVLIVSLMHELTGRDFNECEDLVEEAFSRERVKEDPMKRRFDGGLSLG